MIAIGAVWLLLMHLSVWELSIKKGDALKLIIVDNTII